MTMTPRNALALALLPLAIVAGATGCTRAQPPHSNADTVTAPATGDSSSDAISSTSSASSPATSDVPSTPAASATASTPATVATSSSPAAAYHGPPGCATSALRIVVQRGSGAAGHQFATISFTNSSTAACSLVGYPGAVLLKSGAYLGSPAARSGDPVTPVVLKPGAQASAQLENDSTCNAEVSDSVQIIVPNRTERTVLPLQMRGCPLTIHPVTPG